MSAQSGTPIRVLLVEDAFEQAHLVKTFLASAGGYEVAHSQDGDHAIELIKEQDWDLIVTDLNLPGMGGVDVIREARAKDATLPVLVTTGYSEARYHDRAIRAGANDVLLKPLDKGLFMATVNILTDTNSQPAAPGSGIMAVGGLAGDVEMGCGGALIRAAAAGHPVSILVLCKDEADPHHQALRASKAACDALGFRLVVDQAALTDNHRRVALMRKAVATLRPSVAYLPSMADSLAARTEAFRVARAATIRVPTVLGYQTATSGPDYEPTLLVEIADQMDKKLRVLANFRPESLGRLDLNPDRAKAYARHWGRHERFTRAEAFEVIQGSV